MSNFEDHALAPQYPIGTVRAKVLVVDDERVNRELVTRMLQRAGYGVRSASSGEEALAELSSGREFDLVLLDVVMPGMDGLSVLQEIRRTFTAQQLPVIMCTAAAETKHVVTAFASGASDYITKPVNVAVALARIATHIDHKQAQSALQESQERYALAAIGANDGLWDCDLRTGTVFFSSRWKEMLGIGQASLEPVLATWFDLIHSDDRQRFEKCWTDYCEESKSHFELEYRMQHDDGTYRWMVCRGAAVRDPQGRAIRVAGSLTDITQAKVTDPLTGLPNRLLFLDRLHRCIERVRRSDDRPFGVLFLDLDNFKLINDSFGHEAGDQLLLGVSKRLTSVVRTADSISRCTEQSVARLGGDEFTILLDSIRSPEDSMTVAQRILTELREPLHVAGTQVYANASIGITVGNGDGRTAEDLLREADTAMYHAKSLGRNRCCIFNPQMQEQAALRLALERDLRVAVKKEQFRLQYQPIIRLRTGDCVGVEALVRWHHPQRGLISPSDFMGLAEETGVILPLGEWVLRDALRQFRDWQSRWGQHLSLTVSINCSRKQLVTPAFVSMVKQVIDDNGVNPRQVKLEITETVIMENPDEAAQVLAAIRSMGIRIGLDDFGTGYSCLAMLHRLPLDVLKIDRSFVKDLSTGKDNMAIVRTILSLARSLNLSVVAEGIETEDQRAILTELGCEFGQGYLYSRAVDPSQIEQLYLATSRALVFESQLDGTSPQMTSLP